MRLLRTQSTFLEFEAKLFDSERWQVLAEALLTNEQRRRCAFGTFFPCNGRGMLLDYEWIDHSDIPVYLSVNLVVA